jgi:hypothetical protein
VNFLIGKATCPSGCYIAEYPESVLYDNPWLDQITERNQIRNIDNDDSKLSETEKNLLLVFEANCRKKRERREFVSEKAFRESMARQILPKFRARATKLVDIASDFRSQLISLEYFE